MKPVLQNRHVWINKKSVSLNKKRIFLLVGVQGFEPRKCLSQSQVPYRLATPQYKSPIKKGDALTATYFGWDSWI